MFSLISSQCGVTTSAMKAKVIFLLIVGTVFIVGENGGEEAQEDSQISRPRQKRVAVAAAILGALKSCTFWAWVLGLTGAGNILVF